jgi:hypothetical protein
MVQGPNPLHNVSEMYAALESTVLLLHLGWIVWILLGWMVTRARPGLAWLHVASLVWGIATELGPWACPLTLAEQWLESRSGATPNQQGFLVHYLDKLIYPDVPEPIVALSGAAVCVIILAIHGVRLLRHFRTRPDCWH